MNGFFSIDSPFFRVCSRIADIFLLNLVFVITCLPLVTIGAALTALDAISMKMVKGQEGYIIRGYWKEFCNHFWRSTGLFFLLVFGGAVLGADYYFWYRMGGEIGSVMQIATIVIFCVYVMTALYLFPVQARFGYHVLECLKKSLLMAVFRFPITLLLITYYGVIMYFALQYMVVDLFLIVFGFGLIAMGSAILYHTAFRTIIKDRE